MASNPDEARRGAIAELARREIERREQERGQPAEQPAQRFDFGRSVGYQVGRAAEQVMATVSLPADALAGFVRWAEGAALGPNYEVTMPDGQRIVRNRADTPLPSQTIRQGMAAAGIPTVPQNKIEEFAGDITGSLGSAGAMMGIGGALTQLGGTAGQVGSVLAAQPGLQTAAAVTAPTAAVGAREVLGAGPVGQAVAGTVGALAPSAVAYGAPGAVRRLIRGGEEGQRQMLANAALFRRVGTEASVGQAAATRTARVIEAGLSRSPGGAGPMNAFSEQQAQDVGNTLQARAQALVGRRQVTPETAGAAIEEAVTGPGGYVERFREGQRKLYGALEEFIPPSSRVSAENTRQAFSTLMHEMEGAEPLSRVMQVPRMRRIYNAFLEATEGQSTQMPANPQAALQAAKSQHELDVLAAKLKLFETDATTAEGRALESLYTKMRRELPAGEAQQPPRTELPYAAIARLRSDIGAELSEFRLTSDIPRGQWKALYKGLTRDMQEAAASKGMRAMAAFSRANRYTEDGMTLIDSVKSVIDRRGGHEAIYQAAMSGTRLGASTLRSVMRSLDDRGQRMLSATVLSRMGLANPSAQNAAQNAFSTETFLTNWASLSQEAKVSLFNRYGPTFRRDMDDIASMAENLRKGSAVFRNPSGTAQTSALLATGGAAGLALFGGHWKTLAGIGAATGASNLAAKAMTSPRFVRWLARSTRYPASALPALATNLVAQARESGDEDLAMIALAIQDEAGAADAQATASERATRTADAPSDFAAIDRLANQGQGR